VAVKRRQFSPLSFCDHRHSTCVLRKRLTTKFWFPTGIYCVTARELILRKIIQIIALPRPPSWISGVLLLRGGEMRKGKRGGEERGEEMGKLEGERRGTD